MSKFVVAPHFRLHEWVAEEKGYFAAEGLDYEFRETMDSTSGSGHHIGNKVGAYQTLEAGRTCNVSGACHWTMNVAASNGHGKLYADAYSVSPAGVFVPAESPIKTPADLAGVPISVGYQSGSHYATIQGLDQYLKPDQIKLSFNDGLLFSRMEHLIDRKVPAASLFSGPYYFLEQLGFRKVIDTTFMMASMVTGTPDPEDVRKYFRALRRAQRDIDLRPELFTHYYKKEFPARFHAQMDTRRWGPGERLVFEPYSKQTFDEFLRVDRAARHLPAQRNGLGQLRNLDIPLNVGWAKSPTVPERHIKNRAGDFAHADGLQAWALRTPATPQLRGKRRRNAHPTVRRGVRAPVRTPRGTSAASTRRYWCCSASNDSYRII